MSGEYVALILVVLIAGIGLPILFRLAFSRQAEARHNVFHQVIARYGGVEIPEPKMDEPTLFDLFDKKKNRQLAAYQEERHPNVGLVDIFSAHRARLTIDDHVVTIGYGTTALEEESRSTPIVYTDSTLHKRLPGWVRLRSAQSRFKGSIKETDLESVDFNDAVQVHAYPAKLAYAVLPPDFMEWYLHHSGQPWIYVHEQRLIIAVEAPPTVDAFETILRTWREVIKRIEKSGALERPEGIA